MPGVPCRCGQQSKEPRQGTYSKGELRALKTKDWGVDEVKARFPAWQNKAQLLVRMGGVYADTGSPLFSINGVPQLEIATSDDGLLELSFVLRDQDDSVLVEMKRNWFSVLPSNIHDMVVTPKTKHVQVWVTPDDVGLDFVFARVSLGELQQRLVADAKRAVNGIQLSSGLPPDTQRLIAESFEADPLGPVGRLVLDWAKEHCCDDEDLVPLLDIDTMVLYHHGHPWRIANGVAGFLQYCAAIRCRKGAVNVRCPCVNCRAAGASSGAADG